MVPPITPDPAAVIALVEPMLATKVIKVSAIKIGKVNMKKAILQAFIEFDKQYPGRITLAQPN